MSEWVSYDSLWPHGPYSPWNSPGQNTGVGSRSLLQGIFPTQGSNPGLPHCRRILYWLSHQESPRILEWVAYPFSRDLPDPGIKLGSPALHADSLPTELSGKPKDMKEIDILHKSHAASEPLLLYTIMDVETRKIAQARGSNIFPPLPWFSS